MVLMLITSDCFGLAVIVFKVAEQRVSDKVNQHAYYATQAAGTYQATAEDP